MAVGADVSPGSIGYSQRMYGDDPLHGDGGERGMMANHPFAQERRLETAGGEVIRRFSELWPPRRGESVPGVSCASTTRGEDAQDRSGLADTLSSWTLG